MQKKECLRHPFRLFGVDVPYVTAVDAFPSAVLDTYVIAIDTTHFITVPTDAVLLAALLNDPTFVGADPRTDIGIETEFFPVAAIDVPQVAAFLARHIVKRII